jgi:hypothetical protein
MDIMHMRRWIYLDEIPPDVNPGIDLLVRYTGVKREEIEFHIRAIVRLPNPSWLRLTQKVCTSRTWCLDQSA